MSNIHQRARTQDYRKNASKHQKDNAKKRNAASFLTQNVSLSDYIYLPEGYEVPVLIFYFISLPYAVGLLVIYIFIAERDINNFLTLDIFTIIPVWAIGYETIGSIILLIIFYSGLVFHLRKKARLKIEAEIARKKRHRRLSKADFMKHKTF